MNNNKDNQFMENQITISLTKLNSILQKSDVSGLQMSTFFHELLNVPTVRNQIQNSNEIEIEAEMRRLAGIYH